MGVMGGLYEQQQRGLSSPLIGEARDMGGFEAGRGAWDGCFCSSAFSVLGGTARALRTPAPNGQDFLV